MRQSAAYIHLLDNSYRPWKSLMEPASKLLDFGFIWLGIYISSGEGDEEFGLWDACEEQHGHEREDVGRRRAQLDVDERQGRAALPQQEDRRRAPGGEFFIFIFNFISETEFIDTLY